MTLTPLSSFHLALLKVCVFGRWEGEGRGAEDDGERERQADVQTGLTDEQQRGQRTRRMLSLIHSDSVHGTSWGIQKAEGGQTWPMTHTHTHTALTNRIHLLCAASRGLGSHFAVCSIHITGPWTRTLKRKSYMQTLVSLPNIWREDWYWNHPYPVKSRIAICIRILYH